MMGAASTRSRAAIALSLALLGAINAAPTAAGADSAGVEFFEKSIRPLLAQHCYSCHSSRATKTRGGLRLDSREAILAGGDSGQVIVPGSPENSRLIRAVRYSDPDLQMPPKQRLSPEEIATLETWVRRGAQAPDAVWQRSSVSKRWAFERPREPAIPRIHQTSWIRSPIDCFILAGLEAKKLAPGAAADRPTLLRRATYDLTGLPPTPREVADFLADQSPDAFTRVVDRLLASPRYGERWGRHWLDLVRYTDDFDLAWRYRDWVVKALNADVPYGQFVRQQIAGDLLPAPQPGAVNADGIIATTLLSLGPWGGIDRKKRLADIVDDQIDTIGRTFLGLTLACARCHDHKFDPIPTADYYGLAGIFYSSRIISDKGYLSHGTQRLRIPLVPAGDVEKHRQHTARVQELEQRLETAVEKSYAAFAAMLVPQTDRYLLAAWDYQHRSAEATKISVEDLARKQGLRPFALARWIEYLEGSRLGNSHLLAVPVRDYDGEAGVQVWAARAERPWWGVNTTDHDVPIETFLLPAHSVSVNPGTQGGAVAWKSPVKGKVRVCGRLTDADPQDGSGVAWALDHVSGGRRRELSAGSMPNGGSKTLDQGRNGQRLASIAVQPGDEIVLGVWLREGDAHYDITNVELTITSLDEPGEWNLSPAALHNFLASNPHGDWAFYDMAGSNRKDRMPAVDGALQAWDQAVAGKVDRAALEKIALEFQQAAEKGGVDNALAHALTGIGSPYRPPVRDDAQYLSAEAQAGLARLAAELEHLRSQTPPLPCAHGVQEGGLKYGLFPGFQDARIHIRGSYERLGDRVPRHFPGVLAGDAQAAISSGSGRLELARWIAAAENPLTARVVVNRVWQHHFGEGIVRTPSNFGALGTPPTHPELLDWLARRFIESGWSLKALHRLILLSATYQQSSRPSAALLRADPDNRLWGRMNRRRPEAEELRDGVLAVCGRLKDRHGGPASEDRQSGRRMLYLKSARAERSGFGAVFDAADPSLHVEKRTTSVGAPQALYLMNNSLLLDSVGQLVRRSEVARGTSAERVQSLYRLIFGREAMPEEVSLGCQFIEGLKARPAVGDQSLGAWETYAQALLLANEFLFVD
jgi:hypothetical protein